jgi:hypothetical protein
MAETRRQNLREGLIELHQRKVRTDRAVAYRSAIKRDNREKRLYAPLREDERLTNPTITAVVRKLQVGDLPDPNRAERLAAAAARSSAKQQALEEQRRDALHTLYMHARSFITTEAQLDAEIEKVFTAEPFGTNLPTNIWDALNSPPTVQDMLSVVNNTQKTAMEYHGSRGATTGKRMVRIAEELTGGKMD